MHDSSWEKMTAFIDVYLGAHRDDPLTIVDIGSRIVLPGHATYRTLFDSPKWEYLGLDPVDGLNVELVVADAYRWDEVPADSVDVVISGQVLEHVELFWVTAFEIGRILKPGGITMIIVPSGGWEHRWPVDCWRFYRDGMRAIGEHLRFEVLEAYTEWKRPDWADSALVMRKPLWDDDDRSLFMRRREWQQAAAKGVEPVPFELVPNPVPSILHTAVGGRLEPVLEEIRVAALTPPPEPPPPAPVAVPPSPRWRRVVRRILGPRGVALVRRVGRRVLGRRGVALLRRGVAQVRRIRPRR